MPRTLLGPDWGIRKPLLRLAAPGCGFLCVLIGRLTTSLVAVFHLANLYLDNMSCSTYSNGYLLRHQSAMSHIAEKRGVM